jgi:hypothetical protein
MRSRQISEGWPKSLGSGGGEKTQGVRDTIGIAWSKRIACALEQ